MKLGDLGEDRLLARVLPHLKLKKSVLAGAGDDCAVLEPPGQGKLLFFKTDCVVEGIHFRSREDPVAVGWKAMMRALSDFAAMSGVPRFALISSLVGQTERSVGAIDSCIAACGGRRRALTSASWVARPAIRAGRCDFRRRRRVCGKKSVGLARAAAKLATIFSLRDG